MTLRINVVGGGSNARGHGLTTYIQRFQTASTAWPIGWQTALQVDNFDAGVLCIAKNGTNSYHFRETGHVPGGGKPNADPARNITAAVLVAGRLPDNIVIALSQDAKDGYDATTETIPNLIAARDYALALGVGAVWVCTPFPRNDLTAGQKTENLEARDGIITEFGSFAIDVFTPVKNGSDNLSATYDQGDGIHLNAAGHTLIATTIGGVIPA